MGVNRDDVRIRVMPVEESARHPNASGPSRLMCAGPIGANCRPPDRSRNPFDGRRTLVGLIC